ncbi:MAG: sigma-70 family RNA polymerase sigma factor [Clostridium sp.]|nr:sigma-70 family RNA polymerase sigma factor [Clostridium sp.]
MTEQEFEQAVVRIRSGDKDGLKEIYLAYVKFIYAVIYEILQNKENTEDVTSEFFIKLWDVAERYVPGHGHRGYLATIARNMAIDVIRKRRREVLRADIEVDLGGAGIGDSAGGGSMFDTTDDAGAAMRIAEGAGRDADTPYGSAEDEGNAMRTTEKAECDADTPDSTDDAEDTMRMAEGEKARRSLNGSARSRVSATAGRGAPPGRGLAENSIEDEVIGNIAVEEALALLKDGERQIINMKILGDMTFQEIADTLHMPMGTVTWKYRNAIGKLRRCGYEQGFENGI